MKYISLSNKDAVNLNNERRSLGETTKKYINFLLSRLNHQAIVEILKKLVESVVNGHTFSFSNQILNI